MVINANKKSLKENAPLLGCTEDESEGAQEEKGASAEKRRRTLERGLRPGDAPLLQELAGGEGAASSPIPLSLVARES